MKKLNILLVIVTSLGFFTSCSQDIEDAVVPVAQEVNFDVNVLATRTQTNGRVTTFVENDRMGVFGMKRGSTEMLNRNVMYTYDDQEKWGAVKSITYPLDNSPVNFYAYYPYGEYETTAFDFTVLLDQSQNNGYEKSDLLFAKNETASVGSISVGLQFSHLMAMVEVTPVLPEGITLTSVALLGVHTTSAVDLIQQTATVKHDELAPTIVVKLMKVNDVYRGVVPAQVLKGRILEFIGTDENGRKVMFDYTLDNSVTLQANRITPFEINCTL